MTVFPRYPRFLRPRIVKTANNEGRKRFDVQESLSVTLYVLMWLWLCAKERESFVSVSVFVFDNLIKTLANIPWVLIALFDEHKEIFCRSKYGWPEFNRQKLSQTKLWTDNLWMNLEMNRERDELEFEGFYIKQNSTDFSQILKFWNYLMFNFKMFQWSLI